MEQELKQYLKQHNFINISIPPKHITILHKLFFKDIIPICSNDEISLYCGMYYRLKKDYTNAIKYSLMAFQCNNQKALHNLTDCYREINDYDNALKYWLLDIQQGGIYARHSMNNCAVYYHKQGDHANAVKYYLMADKHGDPNAMNNLAVHYNGRCDYTNAFKCWSLAVERGDTCAMNNLAMHCKIRCDYVNAFKYWTKAVDHNNYNHVSHALLCCRTNDLLTLGSRYVNKILNKSSNNAIIIFTLHFANVMNDNLVNIIINVDHCQTEDVLFNKFKKLLV